MHFKPFLCQILNAPSPVEGANKRLAAIGLRREKVCSPKFFLNWVQIGGERLIPGLLLGLTEESGSAEFKTADRDKGLIALDSIVTRSR